MLAEGALTSDAAGEVETENKVLVLKRIHVVYHLTTMAEDADTVRRVHGFHADYCPVYRSLKAAIAITTEMDWRAGEGG